MPLAPSRRISKRPHRKDLEALTRQRKTAAEKQLKEREDKRAEQEKQEKAAAHLAFAAKVTAQRASVAFGWNWPPHGHNQVEVLITDEDLKRRVDKADPFQTPYIIGDCKLTLLVAQKVLSNWHCSFQAHCTKTKSTFAQHMMIASPGTAELDPFFTTWCPPAKLLIEGLSPSMSAMTKNTWVFGYSQLHVNFDFEPLCLGSIGYLANGEVSFIMAPATGLIAYLEKVIGSTVTHADLLRWGGQVLGAKADDTEMMKDFARAGLHLYQGRLGATQAIVIPPGFIVAASTMGSEPAPGGRKMLLPKNMLARQNLAAILESLPKDHDLKATLRPVVDSLVLATAASIKR